MERYGIFFRISEGSEFVERRIPGDDLNTLDWARTEAKRHNRRDPMRKKLGMGPALQAYLRKLKPAEYQQPRS